MKEPLGYIGDQLLPVLAYGDALGLPHEQKGVLPAGAIERLAPVPPERFGRRLPAGLWSDDTQLSIAVARSLIEAGGFDIDNQAQWHVRALRESRGERADADVAPALPVHTPLFGWGKATIAAVTALESGASPRESGQGSAGNGVIMKLAPLVLWQMARDTPRETSEEQIIALTQMTHRQSEAVVASLVHAEYLKTAAQGIDPLREALRNAKVYERRLSAAPVVSDSLGRLMLALDLGRFDRAEAARSGAGFYAPETLAKAYGSVVLQSRFPGSARLAVELGGDTDSVASVTATLSLFRSQVSRPSDYERLHDKTRLERISRELTRTALQENHGITFE